MFGWLKTLAGRGEQRSGTGEHWFNLSDWSGGDTIRPNVSSYEAMTVGTVYQAISLISGDMAKLPLDLYRKTEAGREHALGHPAYRIVKAQPNGHQTAVQFWRRMYFWALLWGESFAWIERDAQNRVTGLVPIPNYMVDVIELGLPAGVAYRVTLPIRDQGGGETRIIQQANMVHITWLEWEDGSVVEPLAAMQRTLRVAIASEEYANRFYRSGASAGGVLELPSSMSKKTKDTIEEGFVKKYEGPENWFKVVILREGAKFHSTTKTAQDSQTSELREDQVRELARYFNLPPAKVGLADAVSYNSLEQANRAYVESTLQPWARTTEQQLWLKLIGTESQRNHYFEYNFNSLLRADVKTRYEIYASGINSGILSPNECRELENMNRRPGGDVYVNPVTQPGSPVTQSDQAGQVEDETDTVLAGDETDTELENADEGRTLPNIEAVR